MGRISLVLLFSSIFCAGVWAFAPECFAGAIAINAGASSWDQAAGATATIKINGATAGNEVTVVICAGATVRTVRTVVADANGDVTIVLTPRAGQIFQAGDNVSAFERAANGTKLSSSKGSLLGTGAVQNNGNCVPLPNSMPGKNSSSSVFAGCEECPSILPGYSPVSMVAVMILLTAGGAFWLRVRAQRSA